MKIFFCLLFLGLPILIYSQSLLIQYETRQNGGHVEGRSELIITDSLSIWQGISDSSTFEDVSFFIKNYKENLIYSNERLASKEFYVKDSLHSMKWELTNDTANILNEKCFAAKTHFRGRNYKAYYTAKYPISEGPWKFGGLPGLILQVKSDDNYIELAATKIIRDYKGKMEIPKINHIKFLKWDEYVKEYIETIDKWGKLARSNGTLTEDAQFKLKIDATEIIYPKAQLGDGISF